MKSCKACNVEITQYPLKTFEQLIHSDSWIDTFLCNDCYSLIKDHIVSCAHDKLRELTYQATINTVGATMGKYIIAFYKDGHFLDVFIREGAYYALTGCRECDAYNALDFADIFERKEDAISVASSEFGTSGGNVDIHGCDGVTLHIMSVNWFRKKHTECYNVACSFYR